MVLQWKHNAAWTIWCSSADTDTIDGFLLLKEFTASETPSLVTMIESVDPANEWTLCCGARHHFELISASGTSRIIHMEAAPKPHLVAALDLREDEEPELLLCYNSRSRSILTLKPAISIFQAQAMIHNSFMREIHERLQKTSIFRTIGD